MAPLVTACGSADPATRAAALVAWEATQRTLMTRPTMIRWNGDVLSRTSLFHLAAEQGGMVVESQQPEPGEAAPAAVAGPLPFWELVDRLGCVGPYLHQRTDDGGKFPALLFQSQAPRFPTTTWGPFRITLEALHEHRDATLIAGPWVRIDSFGQRFGIPRDRPARDLRLFADLGLLAEPRLWFAQEGPARAVEAIDDLGQSLVRVDEEKVEGDGSIFRNGAGVAQGRVRLDLAIPPRPGSRLVRLRGMVPVALLVRRPVPELDVMLTEVIGRPLTCSLGTFTVSGAGAAAPKGFRVDVRLDPAGNGLPAGERPPLMSERLACLFRHQFDFVDAAGLVVGGSGGGGSWGPDGVGWMTYGFGRSDLGGPPIRLRIYRMLREPAAVEFDFHDVPLP